MRSLNPYFKKLNTHRPLRFNLVLWSLAFVILLIIFSKGKMPITIDYIYTLSFLLSVAIPTVITLYVIIPKLLKKEHYIGFVLAFAVNLVLFSQLHIWYFESILDTLFPNYFFISYHSSTKLIVIFSIFLVAATLLKLSEDWFYFNKEENKNLKQENIQIATQLSALRSQINPHFLFNSLNVLYALTIEKKDTIKDAIVQLSDILRYIIYDSNTKQVALEDEIKLMDNYIAFQKFRVHGFDNIETNYDIEDPEFQIYPMLLLPLIENSFKHGITDDLSKTFIKLSMAQKGNTFSFKISNNCTTESNLNTDENSGVGLENVSKNLHIVYPDQHTFTTENINDIFTVTLTINLN